MGRDLIRHLAQVVGVAAAATALAAWPAWLWGGRPGLWALLLAAGICVTGAALGRVLMVLLRRTDESAEGVARALQVGIGVRLLVTLALSLPFILGNLVPAPQLVAWLAVHYTAQLVLEVFVSLRELGQNRATSDPTAPGSDAPEGQTGTSHLEPATGNDDGDQTE